MKPIYKETKEKILIIDFGNLFFFSKPFYLNEGLLKGHYSVFEQFIINLNSYVRILQPTTVIIADDNFPEWRQKIYPLYKVNRKYDRELTPIEIAYNRNKKEIRNRLKEVLPVYYFRVNQLEADDICYLLCERLGRNKDIVVMSGDKDLLQLSQKFHNVKIYDPLKKQIVEPPDYDIVRYKVLRGDSSDNIKGFPKIGDKKAKDLLKEKKIFNTWYKGLNEQDLELYNSLKNIICLEKIPKEYYYEFHREFDNFEFKKFNKQNFDDFINQYKFKRIDISYISENFNNLKSL